MAHFVCRANSPWQDTGTPDLLFDGAGFIGALQMHQGLMVACPEEMAYRQAWFIAEHVLQLSAPFMRNFYGQYLEKLLTEKF